MAYARKTKRKTAKPRTAVKEAPASKPRVEKPKPPTMPPMIVGPAVIEAANGRIYFGPVPADAKPVGASGDDIRLAIGRISAFLALEGDRVVAALLEAVGPTGAEGEAVFAALGEAFPDAPPGGIPAVVTAARSAGLVTMAQSRLHPGVYDCVENLMVQPVGALRPGRVPRNGYLHAVAEVARRAPTGASVPRSEIPEEARAALGYAVTKGWIVRDPDTRWTAYKVQLRE